MNHVTLALNHWLHKHNIPTENVKISIEFPERRHADAAVRCLMMETENITAYFTPGQRFTTMNGLGLAFRSVEHR